MRAYLLIKPVVIVVVIVVVEVAICEKNIERHAVFAVAFESLSNPSVSGNDRKDHMPFKCRCMRF